MKTIEDIDSEIKNIFSTKWKLRNGLSIPDSDNVSLGNDAVSINATVLYADLKESTNLVSNHAVTFAAEIYKSYLVGCCELIRNNNGQITSFDGDRVMGIFIGDSKNTNAVTTAFQIKYLVDNIINKRLVETYKKSQYKVKQFVGIDTSNLFVAKTGIRGHNDLVWIGNAANIAAKMSSIRSFDYSTYISSNVYDLINNNVKTDNENNNLWHRLYWNNYYNIIYGSNAIWNFNV